MDRKLRKTVSIYYVFQFFFGLLLWVPIFYEFQKKLGLSDPQIFQIQSIYYIFFCLCEIPTGFFADRFGCQRSLQLGAFLLVGANLLPTITFGYTSFLVHFLLIALSRSLISGASSAYLYQYLDTKGLAHQYKPIEGKARALGLIGKVVCWAVVGLLMKWNLFLPYWLTAANAFVSLIAATLLPGTLGPSIEPASSSAAARGSFLADIAGKLLSSPYLLLVMLQGAGVFVLVRLCQVNLYQPILSGKSFDIVSYGWIMSLMTLFEAVGSSQSHRVKRVMSDLAAVFFLTVCMALCLSLVALTAKAGTILGLCLFSLSGGLAFPIQKQLLNDNIRDHRSRATLLSIESILDRAINALAVLPLGTYVGAGQTDLVLFGASGITVIFILAIFTAVKIFDTTAKPLAPGNS